MYGKELIIDLRNCNVELFTRQFIGVYFQELCKLIDMQREDLHFWDDEGVPEHEKRNEPHVVGLTAVQFIITSSITIHSLTLLKECYINIFSCKEFNTNVATEFTKKYFETQDYTAKIIERGAW